jgi:hypothetical protein
VLNLFFFLDGENEPRLRTLIVSTGQSATAERIDTEKRYRRRLLREIASSILSVDLFNIVLREIARRRFSLSPLQKVEREKHDSQLLPRHLVSLVPPLP